MKVNWIASLMTLKRSFMMRCKMLLTRLPMIRVIAHYHQRTTTKPKLIILIPLRILLKLIYHRPKMRSLVIRLETLVIWIHGIKCYRFCICFSSIVKWLCTWYSSLVLWATWSGSSSLSMKYLMNDRGNYQHRKVVDSILLQEGLFVNIDMLLTMHTTSWAEVE